jgi:aminoglycoside 6-adenylyltransferase
MPDPKQTLPGTSEDRHAVIMAALLQWAQGDENIRAMVQTGSSSRSPGATDRFSDRDLELICRDPTPLLTDDAWIHAIAPVWVALYLANDPGDFETRLVFFEGGRKVDFTIADRSHLAAMIETGCLDPLYERGYRVLLDKDGLTADLPAPSGRAPSLPLPTEAEFAATVTEFWFEAAHMPTYLTRDDLWVVKLRDGTMKAMLLRMLEWHAVFTQGPDTDVWHIGTKMQRWADPETWAELQGIFGRFDAADSVRALKATMRLFTRLTHEVADRARFAVPEAERHIQAYVLGFADAFRSSGPA